MDKVTINGQEHEPIPIDDSVQNEDIFSFRNLIAVSQPATKNELARICEISPERTKIWDVSPWLVSAFEDHKHWNPRGTLSGFLTNVMLNTKNWGLSEDLLVIKLISDESTEKINGVRGQSFSMVYVEELGKFRKSW